MIIYQKLLPEVCTQVCKLRSSWGTQLLSVILTGFLMCVVSLLLPRDDSQCLAVPSCGNHQMVHVQPQPCHTVHGTAIFLLAAGSWLSLALAVGVFCEKFPLLLWGGCVLPGGGAWGIEVSLVADVFVFHGLIMANCCSIFKGAFPKVFSSTVFNSPPILPFCLNAIILILKEFRNSPSMQFYMTQQQGNSCCCQQVLSLQDRYSQNEEMTFLESNQEICLSGVIPFCPTLWLFLCWDEPQMRIAPMHARPYSTTARQHKHNPFPTI